MRRLRHHDERGTITFWILWLCVLLLALGGLSLDLWRSFSERRTLAAGADAAALAGASAIDPDRYRTSGELVLDPAEAERRARRSIDQQLDRAALRAVEVEATTESVTVVVRGNVRFSLLGLLEGGDFDVRVVATAWPRRSV